MKAMRPLYGSDGQFTGLGVQTQAQLSVLGRAAQKGLYPRQPASPPYPFYCRWRLELSALLLFEPLDFAFDDFANEGGAPLRANQPVNPFTQSFRQPDDSRFHLERRPSHAAVVTSHRIQSIRSHITDICYCNFLM